MEPQYSRAIRRPNRPRPHLREHSDGLYGGYGYTTEKIDMSTHGTTHVDSISHIDPSPEAQSIDRIPLDWFWTEAICLDLSLSAENLLHHRDYRSAPAKMAWTSEKGTRTDCFRPLSTELGEAWLAY